MIGEKICPLCSCDSNTPVLKDSPFLFCKNCKIIFNSTYCALDYGDSYFLEDYKAQYNKTYEEDFPAITKSANLRLKKIFKLWGSFYNEFPVSLLDIGSALGFFLQTARQKGVKELEGVEISQYASNYCVKNYNIKTNKTSFDDFSTEKKYDVITAWYFLEHSANPLESLKKIISMLNQNGMLAFSFPSFFGPLYKFDRKKWQETHPVDHLVDFSPKTIKKLLQKQGFRKVKVYAAAIHPERVMSKNNIFYPVFSLIYTIYSKIFAFSDTIEVYAIK